MRQNRRVFREMRDNACKGYPLAGSEIPVSIDVSNRIAKKAMEYAFEQTSMMNKQMYEAIGKQRI